MMCQVIFFVAALNLNPIMEPGAISSLKEYPETSQNNAPLSSKYRYNRQPGSLSQSAGLLNPDNSGAALEINDSMDQMEEMGGSDSQE